MMNHLKIFENKILDDILDKISQDGEKSLTSWEKDYLNSYGTSKQNDMEEELKKSHLPKEETTPTDKISQYIESLPDDPEGDDEIQNVWYNISDDDLNEFTHKYKEYLIKTDLNGYDIRNIYWTELPSPIDAYVLKYMKKKGYID